MHYSVIALQQLPEYLQLEQIQKNPICPENYSWLLAQTKTCLCQIPNPDLHSEFFFLVWFAG